MTALAQKCQIEARRGIFITFVEKKVRQLFVDVFFWLGYVEPVFEAVCSIKKRRLLLEPVFLSNFKVVVQVSPSTGRGTHTAIPKKV